MQQMTCYLCHLSTQLRLPAALPAMHCHDVPCALVESHAAVQEGDELVWVEKCTQDCSLLIGTSKGLVLHFVTDDKMVQPQVWHTHL